MENLLRFVFLVLWLLQISSTANQRFQPTVLRSLHSLRTAAEAQAVRRALRASMVHLERASAFCKEEQA